MRFPLGFYDISLWLAVTLNIILFLNVINPQYKILFRFFPI